MREWKRVCDVRLLLALVLIILLNLVLFLREQQTQDYGFASSGADVLLVRKTYALFLDEYREKDCEQAVGEVRALADLKDLYSNVRALLQLRDTLSQTEKGKETWNALFRAQYEGLKAESPEFVVAIENGLELDEGELATQSAAADRLAEQLEYLVGYGDYLSQIQKNRDMLTNFSIFNQGNTFTIRNVEKTADEFAVLEGVTLSLGEDRAITALFSFRTADYLLVLSLALVVLSFLTERRHSLWEAVYATQGGRLRLAGMRLRILAFFSFVMTVLLYGSTLLAGLFVYGGWEDLGRAAQSISIFQTLPMATSVGGLLFRYFLFRFLSAWLLGTLLWLLLSVSSTSIRFSLMLATVLFAVEYVFYVFLPVQSLWNVLKYFNLFSYIELSSLYTNYLNLNLFGWPVGIRSLAVSACIPLLVISSSSCLCVQCFKRPRHSRELFGWAANRLRRLMSRPLRRLRLLGYEGYKLLVLQGGIFIFAVLYYLVSNVQFSIPITKSQTDLFALQWQGEICDGTWEQINAKRVELVEGIAVYQKAREQYQSGTLDAMEYYNIINLHGGDETSLANLEKVADAVRRLEDRGNELGTTLWLLCETPYREVLGADAQDNRAEWNLLVLVALALIVPGIVTAEQSAEGLRKLTHATLRGRSVLLRQKFFLTVLVSTAAWLLPTMLEAHQLFSGDVNPATLDAPVQSLSFLIDFPVVLSIRTFLLLLWLFRWTVLTGFAFLVLSLSSLVCKQEHSVLLALAVFALPSVLWQYLDLDVARVFSAVLLSDFIPLLIIKRGSIIVAFPIYAAFLALTTGGIVIICRRFGGTGMVEKDKLHRHKH